MMPATRRTVRLTVDVTFETFDPARVALPDAKYVAVEVLDMLQHAPVWSFSRTRTGARLLGWAFYDDGRRVDTDNPNE